MKQQGDIRSKLFGEVLATPTGSYVPDQEWLHGPLENPKSVALYFCKGCGFSAEVGEARTKELASRAGASLPDIVPRGTYFQTDECCYCGRNDHGVVIKIA
jgi:hypothetical protein